MQHPAEDRKKMLHPERVDMGRVEAFGYDSQPSQPWDMICCQVHDPLTFFGVLTSIVIGGLALGFGIAGFTQAHSNADKIAVLEAAPPPSPTSAGTDCCFNQMKTSSAAFQYGTTAATQDACSMVSPSTFVFTPMTFGSNAFNSWCGLDGLTGSLGSSYTLSEFGQPTLGYTSSLLNFGAQTSFNPNTERRGMLVGSANAYAIGLCSGTAEASRAGAKTYEIQDFNYQRARNAYQAKQPAGSTGSRDTWQSTAGVPQHPKYGGGTFTLNLEMCLKAAAAAASGGGYDLTDPLAGAGGAVATPSSYHIPFVVNHQCTPDGRILATHSLLLSQAQPTASDMYDLSSLSGLNDLHHQRYLDAACP